MSLRQRRQQLCEAAARGDLDALEAAVDSADCLPTSEVLEAAAAADQRPACEWLRERGCPWGGALTAAAGKGHLSTCDWLLANGCPWDEQAVYAAARGGHMDLVGCLLLWPSLTGRPKGSKWLSAMPLLEAVAEGCRLPVLRLLHRSLLQGEYQQVLLLLQAEALRGGGSGSLPCSPRSPRSPQNPPPQLQPSSSPQHPHSNNSLPHSQPQPQPLAPPLTPTSLMSAPIPERTLRWIRAVCIRAGGGFAAAPGGSDLPALVAAAAGSHTDDWGAKVEWLEGLGFCIPLAPPNAGGRSLSSRSSAAGGSFGSSSEGPPGGSEGSGVSVSVSGGGGGGGPPVEQLGGSFEAGLPQLGRRSSVGERRSPRVCARAAAMPDAVQRLEWLRARGYPADEAAAEAAARAGNLQALEYLLGPQGNPGLKLGPGLAQAAAEGGYLEVLQALRARGCPLQECLSAAAGSGDRETVAWLVGELGVAPAQVGSLLVRPALRSGSVELVAWLKEERCSIGFNEAVAAAAAGGHLGLAMWALETPGVAPTRPAAEVVLFTAAAALGSVELLTRLRERGCPMPLDGEPYVLAGRNGDLATLRCLRQLGCPFGSDGSMFTRCVYDEGLRRHLAFARRLGECCCCHCGKNNSAGSNVHDGGDDQNPADGPAAAPTSASGCSSPSPSSGSSVSCGNDSDCNRAAGSSGVSGGGGGSGSSGGGGGSSSSGGGGGWCQCARDSPLGALQWLVAAGYPVDQKAAREAARRRGDEYHVAALLRTATRVAFNPLWREGEGEGGGGGGGEG